jgi:hypothetical protein
VHVKSVVFTLTKISIVDYVHNGMMIPKFASASQACLINNHKNIKGRENKQCM